MKARCSNPKAPNYANYGGRGIGYDSRWEYFENFLEDLGTRPPGTTLERIDNDAGYCKSNCKWATASEQQKNKRPFQQPAGKAYGLVACGACLAMYVKKSPISKRCPKCRPGRRKLLYETQ